MRRLGLLLLVLIWTLTVPARAETAGTGAVVFEGNERFNEARLLRALRRYDAKLEGKFDVMDADDAAYFLREFYFTEGFPDARVAYDFSAIGPRVVFTIDEGRRVALGQIEFEGNHFFPSARLKDIVEAFIRQATLNPFGRLDFVEMAVYNAGTAIIAEYHRMGFRNVMVHADALPGTQPNTMDVQFHVEEGIQFHLKAIHSTGLPADVESPAELLSDRIGHPLPEDSRLLLNTRVVSTLRNAGFFEARVESNETADQSTGDVDLEFQIEPGRIYRIGTIQVEGYRHSMLGAVMKRFGVREGERYNASKLAEGTRRLWFSGAFSDATTQLEPRQDGTIDIKLQLQETAAKQIKFGVGYGEWDQFYSDVTYTDRNFFGTLRRFEVDTFVSTKRYGVTLELTDPFLFNTDTDGTLGLVFLRQYLPAYQAYFFGGYAALERQFTAGDLTGYRLAYQWRTVRDTKVFAGEEFVGQTEEDYTVGQLQFGQILDRRNDMLVPMQGYQLLYDVGVASRVLGGDVSFFSMEAQATYYYPLREITSERPFVPFLMINHRAGMLVPFDDTDALPVPERFFLGGPDTVRSFQFDGMPPRDPEGNLLGGEAYWVVNLEAQVPIYRALFGVVFTDIGNLSPALSSYEEDNTRIALGGGLRFYTPIGALRVDYGYNLIRRDGDPFGAWQFGFGFTF